jgi:UPF0716 protein FxsA
MNMAKVLLLAILALPVLELVVFGAVAAAIGFGWALLLLAGGSLAGLLVLRHAGGNHIARMRVAMAQGSISSLTADSTGGLVLLAGFLLLVPGFITDVVGIALLLASLAKGRRGPPPRSDGVVDLEPEQWRRVPEPALRDARDPERPPG